MTFCRIRTLDQDYYLLVEHGSIEHGSIDDFTLALSDGTDVWHGSGKFPNSQQFCSNDLVKLFRYMIISE